MPYHAIFQEGRKGTYNICWLVGCDKRYLFLVSCRSFDAFSAVGLSSGTPCHAHVVYAWRRSSCLASWKQPLFLMTLSIPPHSSITHSSIPSKVAQFSSTFWVFCILLLALSCHIRPLFAPRPYPHSSIRFDLVQPLTFCLTIISSTISAEAPRCRLPNLLLIFHHSTPSTNPQHPVHVPRSPSLQPSQLHHPVTLMRDAGQVFSVRERKRYRVVMEEWKVGGEGHDGGVDRGAVAEGQEEGG